MKVEEEDKVEKATNGSQKDDVELQMKWFGRFFFFFLNFKFVYKFLFCKFNSYVQYVLEEFIWNLRIW